MLKRTLIVLFFIAVFIVGGLSSVSKSMERSEPDVTTEGDYLEIPKDASVPSSKRIVMQEKDGEEIKNVEYCIDYNQRTGCPVVNRAPYACENPKQKVPIDENFVIGSTNNKKDTKGPTKHTFIADINSDMRCPAVKAAHNPCQWIILGGKAYGPICWQ